MISTVEIILGFFFEIISDVSQDYSVIEISGNYSTQIVIVPLMAIEGKCEVRKKHDLPAYNAPAEFQQIFFC